MVIVMKISLKIKTLCMIFVVGIVLTVVACVVSYNIYSNTMDEHYRTMTMNLAKTEATILDKVNVWKVTQAALDVYRDFCEKEGGVPDFDLFSDEDWSNYYAHYAQVTQSPEYISVLEQLQELERVNDVDCMYICYMDQETGKAIYIVDGAFEDACPMGTCDNIEDENLELILQNIYDFPAYITNYEDYGWLCSAASGIIDENGQILANAYVDISMDDVMRDREEFLRALCVLLVSITVVLMLLLLWLINKTVVRPINTLANAAGSFIEEREKNEQGVATVLSQINIKSGDEIEKLAVSFKKMETEINTYIENITAINAEKERIGAELNVATQIQADMLPNIFPAFPEYDEFDIYASMQPAKEVGGDFYDFFMIDDKYLAVVMADVSGKGVPAALFMVIAKTLIKNHALNKEQPKDIFTNVNNQLCENNEVGMFVTGWLGIIDITSGYMTYVNAGHNYPLVVHADGTVEWIKSRPGFVLAGMDGTRYRQNELQLETGDTLYLYTDGVSEALDLKQELFGDDRLEKALSENGVSDMTPKEMIEHISAKLEAFASGAEQADDITMLSVTMKKFKENPIDWDVWEGAADVALLEEVQAFIGKYMEEAEFSMAMATQMEVAVEEIFVNIASYAYVDGTGNAVVKCRLNTEEKQLEICFEDWGVPYNPLEKQDPDITLSAEERRIGGLGIYMVKKSMDDVIYEYAEGKNCLTLVKKYTKE